MDSRSKEQASVEWGNVFDDFQSQLDPKLDRLYNKKSELMREWMRTDIDESTRELIRLELDKVEEEIKSIKSK